MGGLRGVVPATISCINFLKDAAALHLARGSNFLRVFDKPGFEATVPLSSHVKAKE